MKEATTVQRAHAYGTSPDCFEQCPGGNQCICNYRRHTLHICASETCYCHTRQRYEAVLPAINQLPPVSPQKEATSDDEPI